MLEIHEKYEPTIQQPDIESRRINSLEKLRPLIRFLTDSQKFFVNGIAVMKLHLTASRIAVNHFDGMSNVLSFFPVMLQEKSSRNEAPLSVSERRLPSPPLVSFGCLLVCLFFSLSSTLLANFLEGHRAWYFRVV